MSWHSRRSALRGSVGLLTRRTILAAAPAALAFGVPLLAARPARAAKQYGPGVTDSEIKIGNTAPYSGPLSNASPIPISMAAYFKMINDQGGVNGRKITFISNDDGYSPPKTVEMTRKLVESDEVLFISGSIGTPTNSAIWHYMNQQKVPQLFPGTGATKWDDPKGHPWTMGFFVSYQAEGRIYAAYILKNKPDAKIGVLYQNDDFGKDYLKGLVDGLGDQAATMIKVKTSYETTDVTVDSQIVELHASGCDVLFTVAIPKFGAHGDPKGGRNRMEAAAHSERHRFVGRRDVEAGRPRKCQGDHQRQFLQGRDRSRMAKRSGLQIVGLVHGQVLPERRQDRLPERLRPVDCRDDRPGAEAMRR